MTNALARMPLYEYECQACGHQLEAQQRMADAALVTCPKCNKDELQKLISATSFHLKGGGWYKDLYSSGTKSDGGGTSKPSSDAPAAATPSPSTGGSPPSHAPNKGDKT